MIVMSLVEWLVLTNHLQHSQVYICCQWTIILIKGAYQKDSNTHIVYFFSFFLGAKIYFWSLYYGVFSIWFLYFKKFQFSHWVFKLVSLVVIAVISLTKTADMAATGLHTCHLIIIIPKIQHQHLNL